MKQKVSHSRLQMVGLFANFSKNFIYMKLENSSQSATGKVALIGSLEGLVNILGEGEGEGLISCQIDLQARATMFME